MCRPFSQYDRKLSPVSGRALTMNPATMTFHKIPDQVEPDTKSLLRRIPRSSRLAELPEDTLHVPRFDPAAIVFHDDAYLTGMLFEDQVNSPTVPGKLECIGQQVKEGYLDLLSVHIYFRVLQLAKELIIDIFCFCLLNEAKEHLMAKLYQVEPA